jgi:hypothetical protein
VRRRAGPAARAGGVQTAGSVGTTVFPPGHRPSAPAVFGATLTGARLRLAGYRGSVVVLNFWASWCVPCKAEGPVLARLWRAYQARGVRFLGDDVSDTRASAAAFERRCGSELAAPAALPGHPARDHAPSHDNGSLGSLAADGADA